MPRSDLRGEGARYAQAARFGLVGAFNTALDFGLLFVFVSVLGLNPYIGNIASTGICLVVSFMLNKAWTFRSQGTARSEFVRFLIVTLAGLWGLQTLLIWSVSAALGGVLQGAGLLFVAKLVATVGSTLWNYKLYKKVVFRRAAGAPNDDERDPPAASAGPATAGSGTP